MTSQGTRTKEQLCKCGHPESKHEKIIRGCYYERKNCSECVCVEFRPKTTKIYVPRGFENTRYSTDVCLVCHRIVRRDLKPDGACPDCGNKTEWKHERLYSENDT